MNVKAIATSELSMLKDGTIKRVFTFSNLIDAGQFATGQEYIISQEIPALIAEPLSLADRLRALRNRHDSDTRELAELISQVDAMEAVKAKEPQLSLGRCEAGDRIDEITEIREETEAEG